jgi:hypothetical protein
LRSNEGAAALHAWTEVEAKKPGAAQNSKRTRFARRRRRRRRKQRQLFFIRWVTVRTEEYSFCSSAGGAVMGSMLQLFYILNSHIDI